MWQTWSETLKTIFLALQFIIEPVHEMTNNLHRRKQSSISADQRLCFHYTDSGKRDCTIHVAKTKALISFAVTAVQKIPLLLKYKISSL